MIRALSTAVTGLRAHQFKMDAIGHNIANVNTYGYKTSEVRFKDLMSQMVRGSSRPELRGGVNPLQMGLGVQVASNIVNHALGAIKSTGRVTDMAVEGDGFFVVSDGIKNYYTRDGSFGRDSHGYLVNHSGMRLMGWMGDRLDPDNPIRPSDELEGINIPLGDHMVANASTFAGFVGNLDARAEIDNANHVYIYDHYAYDTLGRRYDLEYEFDRTAGVNPNTWEYRVGVYEEMQDNIGLMFMAKRYVTGHDAVGDPIYSSVDPIEVQFVDPGVADAELDVTVAGNVVTVNLATDTTGELSSTYRDIQLAIEAHEDAKQLVNIKLDSRELRQEIASDNTAQVELLYNGAQGELIFNDAGSIVVGLSTVVDLSFNPEGAEQVDIALDFDRLTQLAANSNALVREHDGYGAGELAYFSVVNNGDVMGAYTNGQVRNIGTLALSTFINPEGLNRHPGNLYDISANSGDPNIGFAGVGGRGLVEGGALEMSNVDLSLEFTEMIITSRGFQANTRIVTSADEILVEVLNMKR